MVYENDNLDVRLQRAIEIPLFMGPQVWRDYKTVIQRVEVMRSDYLNGRLSKDYINLLCRMSSVEIMESLSKIVHPEGIKYRPDPLAYNSMDFE